MKQIRKMQQPLPKVRIDYIELMSFEELNHVFFIFSTPDSEPVGLASDRACSRYLDYLFH